MISIQWSAWFRGVAAFVSGGAIMGGFLIAGANHAPPTSVAQGFRPYTAVPMPLPAITKFPVATVKVAKKEKLVRDNESVLGVVVGGQARAYPINQMTGPSREIFNDVVGGRAIAATW